ncbi:MAG: EAL domain-containing protein [Zymomonas mobilis]|nr:EAL domain-containing protein [Zymomonas mobilis]
MAQLVFVGFITIPVLLYTNTARNSIFNDIIFPFIPTIVFGCFCIYRLKASSFILFFISQFIYFLKLFQCLSPQFSSILEDVEFFFCNAILLYLFDAYRLSSWFSMEKKNEAESPPSLAIEAEIEQQANCYDTTTGLANRKQFFIDIQAVSPPYKEDNIPFSIGIIDIDGFKRINEIYGHDVGDFILDKIGHRLYLALRHKALVYRIGNDEFGFILPGNKEISVLNQELSSIIEAISTPIYARNNHIVISCSVGCASSYFGAANNSQQIFEHADYALSNAKDQGGQGQVVVFDLNHELRLKELALIERALEKADFGKEFFLQFQPIIDSRTEKIAAFESLARWKSPGLGMIAPDKFIRVAEQTGVILRLTPIFFQKALQEAQKWPSSIKISFNLSAHDISREKQIDHLIDILRLSNISPSRIEFELTETAVMHNFAAAFSNVKKLQAIGASIALDDFGTGYSSLSHLQNFPLNKIKIDRSFVTGLEYDNKNYKIIKSIINLCREIGLECVAEGVEDKEKIDLLSHLGVYLIQGYYYSPPLSSEPANIYIRNHLSI